MSRLNKWFSIFLYILLFMLAVFSFFKVDFNIYEKAIDVILAFLALFMTYHYLKVKPVSKPKKELENEEDDEVE